MALVSPLVVGLKGAIFHYIEPKEAAMGIPQEISSGLGFGF